MGDRNVQLTPNASIRAIRGQYDVQTSLEDLEERRRDCVDRLRFDGEESGEA
ncbi:hypothetical protein [Salinigranum sp. GCM10025319]|uniref:hypothetical protein n=1 Tax=Salinigranum sp. GCM10025319 TaxID=3252687 RepID=UPI00360D5112